MTKLISKLNIYTVAITLCILNFANYIDRMSMTAVTEKYIKCPFEMSDKQRGLLSTAFYVSYTLVSPFVGYLGDNFNRKNMVIVGLLIWIFGLVMNLGIETPSELPSEQWVGEVGVVCFENSTVCCEPASSKRIKFNFILIGRVFYGIGESVYINLAPGILTMSLKNTFLFEISVLILWLVKF